MRLVNAVFFVGILLNAVGCSVGTESSDDTMTTSAELSLTGEVSATQESAAGLAARAAAGPQPTGRVVIGPSVARSTGTDPVRPPPHPWMVAQLPPSAATPTSPAPNTQAP
jgi:hypothetical protein